MASSSSYVYAGNNADSFDLRYESMKCHCNIKASIKIVGPNKDSRGKLYYTCERRNCNFFAWCKPVAVSGLPTPLPNVSVKNELEASIALATQMQQSIEQNVAIQKRTQLMLTVFLVVVTFVYLFK